MFHIYSIDSIRFNVPFESLKTDKEVNRLEKGSHARKVIDKKEDNRGEEGGDEKLSVAVKAYKDAIKVSKDEPILHAYEIMKSPVLTLTPEMNIAAALELFRKNNISHMPVFSGEKKIIGIVSDRDLLNSLTGIDCDRDTVINKTVSDIMVREVITADRITDIRRIAKAMFERHIGTMPIVDDAGKLVGIITRSDILYALISYPPINLIA